MNKPLLNIIERAASSAIFAFTGAVPVANVAFHAGEAKIIEAGLVTAGLAAVQSVLKNANAYFAAQGNGPDALDVPPVPDQPADDGLDADTADDSADVAATA